MIKGIVFDCFGVLYGGSLEYFASIAPKDRVRDVVDINRQKDYGYISLEEYLEQTGEILGKSPDEIATIVRRKHVRNRELVDFVRQVRSEYKTAMLSNIGERMMDELIPPDEQAELFDAVVLSYREGLVKPHPEVFVLTADRMGLNPSECVMIDDIEENCDGAEIAGMQSIRHVNNDLTREKLARILKSNS